MNFKEELFAKYEIRKNKKQKANFIEWVKKLCREKKWEVNVEQGALGTKNIIIGNPEEAKIIFTAHYDTCANMFLPNFITPRNFLVYLIYQIILCLILMIPCILISVILGCIFPNHIELTSSVSSYLLLFILIMLIAGPANKHTANDNTSGVATILQCLEKFNPEKDKVAFILFDLEEAGLIGSSSYASKHKDIAKNTLLINYDCVSDGNTILFVLNKKTKELTKTFEEAFENTESIKVEIVHKGVFYPSDQASFKKGIGVCAMKKNKIFKTGYIDRIHTNKDTMFSDENIEFLAEGSCKLYKNITK